MILVFDTETTGLTKHPDSKDEVQPRVIEFAGVLTDENGEIQKEVSFLINPGIEITEEITKITGITNDDLKDAPGFTDVAAALKEIFESCDAVLAHNLSFDMTMISMEVARAGMEPWRMPARQICTVQEHAEEWGRRPRLTELYEHYFNEPLNQTHRAMDDVKALLRVAAAAGVLS